MEHEDVSGQGMWGAADLRQRERVLHDQEHDRQKQAKRRMLEQRQRAQWQAEDEQEQRERTRASGRAHDVVGELGGRGPHVSFGGHEEMGGEEERRREQNGHELSGHELSGEDSWSHAHQQLREVGVGVGSDPFGRRENADVSDGQVGGGGDTHTRLPPLMSGGRSSSMAMSAGGGGEEGDWPFVDRDEVLAAMSASGKVALPALLRGPKTPVIFGL